jgi:uncharacterized protein (TIGR02246 family)
MPKKKGHHVLFKIAMFAGLVMAIESFSFTALADEQDNIYQVIDQWMTYWENGDAVGIASLYTENAVMYAPNAEPLVGRDAIANFIQGMMDAGIARNLLVTEMMIVAPISFEKDWHLIDYFIAYELGHFSLYEDGVPDPVDHGPYMVLWVRKDGKWMLHRDMLNSGRPQ